MFAGMESWLPWLAPEHTAVDELDPMGTGHRVRSGQKPRAG